MSSNLSSPPYRAASVSLEGGYDRFGRVVLNLRADIRVRIDFAIGQTDQRLEMTRG